MSVLKTIPQNDRTYFTILRCQNYLLFKIAPYRLTYSGLYRLMNYKTIKSMFCVVSISCDKSHAYEYDVSEIAPFPVLPIIRDGVIFRPYSRRPKPSAHNIIPALFTTIRRVGYCARNHKFIKKVTNVE